MQRRRVSIGWNPRTFASPLSQNVARRLHCVHTEDDAVHEYGAEGRGFKTTYNDVRLLDAASERDLLSAALRGDARAASELVQSHIRLVMKIAARYRRSNLPWEDLVSEGVLGLLEAMRRFDLAQDTRFAAYACWWIRARVGQYALANRRLVRVPGTRAARSVARGLRRTEHQLSQRLARPPTLNELATELGVSVADVAEVRAALGSSDLSLTMGEGCTGIELAAECESPEQAVERSQHERTRERCIRVALAKLSSRERQIVREQYFEEHGRSLSELGLAYGVSRQRVGQLLSNARGKLKQELTRVA
jgi:RNA polymerase sigma-32 factor